MLIAAKKIIGFKVKTKSGQRLGRVVDFYIENDTSEIIQFEVESDAILGLMGKKLLIHRRQIIEFNESEIIVEDGTVKQGKLVPAIDF